MIAKHMSSARYLHAVQAAAVAGHRDIVLTFLDRGSPFANSLCDDAIICTVKASQASMMELLLGYRPKDLDSNKRESILGRSNTDGSRMGQSRASTLYHDKGSLKIWRGIDWTSN